MDVWIHVIALMGGFAAGCINTLAGNGSAITLTILTELMHLPPNVANATNRIGILFNSGAALFEFNRKGKWDIKGTEVFIISSVAGGIVGVWLATIVSNEQFMAFFKFMMVLMLFIIIFKPDRWIRQAQVHRNLPLWAVIPIYFAIGVYGGFIQMGMGIFFLVIMVLVARFNVIKANIAKMVVTLAFTIFSLALFSWRGMIQWEAGILMAVGQGAGALLTANLASKSPKAGLIAYWMLIVGMLLSLFKLFNLDEYLFR
jgi:uncharacterized protein